MRHNGAKFWRNRSGEYTIKKRQSSMSKSSVPYGKKDGTRKVDQGEGIKAV